MNLKLAEYEGGKFERFLEIGKDFGYFGTGIIVHFSFNVDAEDAGSLLRGRLDGIFATKDKKDPLNRFDGLFNGRTYGDGRFVLIESFRNGGMIYSEDDIFSFDEENQDLDVLSKDLIVNDTQYVTYGFTFSKKALAEGESFLEKDHYFLGNLHENPELYEKIK